MVVLALIVLAAIFAPWLSPHPFDEVYWDQIGDAARLSPTAIWFGTDNIGRDLFVRVPLRRPRLAGGRHRRDAGQPGDRRHLRRHRRASSAARSTRLMMRFVDILYSLPFMFFVIILMVVFGRNIILLFVAHRRGRVADHGAHRARPDAVGEAQGVHRGGARRRRARTGSIVLRHIVPNVLGPVVVYVTLTVPEVILTESFLSFLGLGVQEPYTSWGVLISEGAGQMESAPWMLIFPALFLARHAVLLQLHRRRPARRARPEGPLRLAGR